MFERLLVPLDGSETSELVLPYAQQMAKEMGSTLLLVRVIPSLAELITIASTSATGDTALAAEGLQTEFITEQHDQERVDAERYLTSTQSRLAAESIKSETAVLEGRPADAIVQYAKEAGA